MQLAHDTHDQGFRPHLRPTHASTVSPSAGNMSDTDRRTLDPEHEIAQAHVGGAVTDAENGEDEGAHATHAKRGAFVA